MAAIVDYYQDKVLAALALDAVRPAISYQDISVVVPILEALTSSWMQVKQFIVVQYSQLHSSAITIFEVICYIYEVFYHNGKKLYAL